MNLEERITELETRLTFQEGGIQALSDVLARQQQQLESMQEMLQEIQARLKELAATKAAAPTAEPPPPHY